MSDHDMRDIDTEYTPVLGVLTGPERTQVRLDALERRIEMSEGDIEALRRNLRHTETLLHQAINSGDGDIDSPLRKLERAMIAQVEMYERDASDDHEAYVNALRTLIMVSEYRRVRMIDSRRSGQIDMQNALMRRIADILGANHD